MAQRGGACRERKAKSVEGERVERCSQPHSKSKYRDHHLKLQYVIHQLVLRRLGMREFLRMEMNGLQGQPNAPPAVIMLSPSKPKETKFEAYGNFAFRIRQCWLGGGHGGRGGVGEWRKRLDDRHQNCYIL